MDELDRYLAKFAPIRDSSEWVTEDPMDYAKRMRCKYLPNWPVEVLIEWFHRHAGHIYDYAFLKFESFIFSKQEWPLDKIPSREAFADPKFCDDFSNVERRAENRNDWLARYMLEHGTWNTPIILLQVNKEIIAPSRLALNRPFHLLEGHRRLSFLNGMRKFKSVKSHHLVWVAGLSGT